MRHINYVLKPATIDNAKPKDKRMLRFCVSRWLPPFHSGLEFIGHSGITGTVAFACPARHFIVVGTVNQLADRGRHYRLMIRAALAAHR